jgi:hypothetical protein
MAFMSGPPLGTGLGTTSGGSRKYSRTHHRTPQDRGLTKRIGLDFNDRWLLIDHMNACLENWLNAADRVAFCILRGYRVDKDWKTEYRGYFVELVKAHQDKYGPGSIYNKHVGPSSQVAAVVSFGILPTPAA